MIRFIYDEAGHEIQAAASGCATEIAAELGVLINISYNLMRTRSPEMAEFFKHRLTLTMHPDSPTWDKDNVPDPSVGVKFVRFSNNQKEDLRG